MSRRITLATSALALTLLGGCLSTHPDDDKNIASALDQSGTFADAIQAQTNTTSLVRVHGQYTSGHMVKRGKEAKLPPAVRNMQFGLAGGNEYTIDQLAKAITARSGVQIRVIKDDVISTGGGGGGGDGAGSAGPGIEKALAFANSLGGVSPDVSSRGPTLVPDVEGKFPDVMDSLAEQLDFDWTVDNTGTVVWNTGVTDVIAVPLPPQKNVMSNTISGATDSGGGGTNNAPTAGSTTQDSGYTITLDPWESLQRTATAMLAHRGRAIADRSNGYLVAQTTPRGDRALHAWYDPLERSLLARVGIEVTIFYVDITDSNNFGFNLNAVFNSLKGPLKGLNVGLGGVAPSIVGAAGSTTIGIVNAPAGSDLSQFNGTQAVLQALAQANRLVDARTLFAESQNNNQAAISLTTKEDYLKNIIFNTTGLSGTSSTSTDVETLNYGFSAQVLPRIVSRDQISLTVSVETAGTPTKTQQPIGQGQEITLATRDVRKIPASVVIGSGETQIVSGYDYKTTTSTDQGVGQSDFLALGGSQNGSTRRIRAYLAIRATLVPATQPNNTVASLP